LSTQLVSTASDAAPIERRSPRRDLSGRDWFNFFIRSLAITFVIGALATGGRIFSPAFWAVIPAFHPHWPNWAPLAGASAVIKIHVATVLAAALVGLVLMLRIKGTAFHRTLGYGYMAAMFVTGIVTLAIPRPPVGPHLGPFGPLHLFSLFALIGVPAALWFARQGRWMIHGRIMGGLFVGGIGIAGVGAFTPGRIMWQVFFG
jgi:uncharacterized membrane protein